VRNDVLRAVVHEQGDGLAGLHAQLLQMRGHGIAGLIHLAPADVLAVPDIGIALGMLARIAAQGLMQGNEDFGFSHGCLLGVS
jgi:hypothetical protein